MGKTHNRLNKKLLGVVSLITIIVCLGACSPKHSSYSAFSSIYEEGWTEGTPINFQPQYGDSLGTYDVTLAVRHAANYDYNNLCLSVDFISPKAEVVRKNVNFDLADDFGNWKGGGFGDVYQCSVVLAQGVHPKDVKEIVVWPSMKGCKILKGLIDVGIIVTPSK